jgi:hypothetical protein
MYFEYSRFIIIRGIPIFIDNVTLEIPTLTIYNEKHKFNDKGSFYNIFEWIMNYGCSTPLTSIFYLYYNSGLLARMGATSETGTAYPSGAPEFTPSF